MAAPVWSAAINVQPVVNVATGNTVRSTLNLQNKFGGRLFIRAMRCTNTGPSAGLYITWRYILTGTPAGGAGTVDITHPAGAGAFQDSLTAGHITTLNGTPSIPTAVLTLTSGTGFAAGALIGISNSVSAPTRIEFARASKISGTTYTMDRTLTNTAIATGDTVTDNAIVLPAIDLAGTPGTAELEIIWDLGPETTCAYNVEAWAQTLNSVA